MAKRNTDELSIMRFAWNALMELSKQKERVRVAQWLLDRAKDEDSSEISPMENPNQLPLIQGDQQ